LGVKAGTPEW